MKLGKWSILVVFHGIRAQNLVLHKNRHQNWVQVNTTQQRNEKERMGRLPSFQRQCVLIMINWFTKLIVKSMQVWGGRLITRIKLLDLVVIMMLEWPSNYRRSQRNFNSLVLPLRDLNRWSLMELVQVDIECRTLLLINCWNERIIPMQHSWVLQIKVSNHLRIHYLDLDNIICKMIFTMIWCENKIVDWMDILVGRRNDSKINLLYVKLAQEVMM